MERNIVDRKDVKNSSQQDNKKSSLEQKIEKNPVLFTALIFSVMFFIMLFAVFVDQGAVCDICK